MLEVGQDIEVIACGKDCINDLVIKLNNIIEISAANAGDDGGSYDRCRNEVKESIEDLLCFLDIDNKCDIIDTKHIGKYSPYLIEYNKEKSKYE